MTSDCYAPFHRWDFSSRKEFAPKGSEFFPLREVPYGWKNLISTLVKRTYMSRWGVVDKPLALFTRGGLRGGLSCWWDVKHKHNNYART